MLKVRNNGGKEITLVQGKEQQLCFAGAAVKRYPMFKVRETQVKWALESITTNKASGGDGIPIELFQILKDDAVKVLHSICQQIWKTQQWPQD